MQSGRQNGNLPDDGLHTYQYNYRNLLTRVVNKADGTGVASYGYDALGRRIFKTVDGTMTRYVFEGVHIIAEVAADDSIAKEYIYGNSIDDPIVLFTPSRTWQFDLLGEGRVFTIPTEYKPHAKNIPLFFNKLALIWV